MPTVVSSPKQIGENGMNVPDYISNYINPNCKNHSDATDEAEIEKRWHLNDISLTLLKCLDIL